MRFWFVCMVKAFRRWLTMKLLAGAVASLLLCSAAVAEDPTFAIWHIDGHGYRWQQDQLDAGLPLERSIRMMSMFENRMNNPKDVARLDADAAILSLWNGHDVVLRMNNIGPELDKTVPRVSPLSCETWRQSHMSIVLKSDGTLEDTPVVSPWADTAAWSTAGRRWAESLWMKRLQAIIPNPTGWILRENNEGGRHTLRIMWEEAKAKYLNHNNVYVWLDGEAIAKVPREKWLNEFTLQPFTPDWRQKIPTSGVHWRWKLDSVLDATVDLRAKEWRAQVDPESDTYPAEFQDEFYTLENAQYHALYDAFEAKSAPGWQGNRIGTVGYGDWDENQQNPAASPPLYLAYYRPPSLTQRALGSGQVGNYYDWVLQYRDRCIANNAGWQELSIGINKKIIYAGAVAGQHDAIDPEAYAGYMTWVSWALHIPGKPFRGVGWEGYLTKDTQRLFTDADAPLLASIGRSDLLPVTVGNYEVELLKAFDFIHDNPVVSRYRREGTTRVLSSPLNDASSVRVWATETTIPGETRKLLYVFTPCTLTGEIEVGEWTVPSKKVAYYLTPVALEEVQ